MDNKNIFASNLKRYMKDRKVSRKDISEALGISYYTVTDWVNGKKYPRMNRVEELAHYFGILKSDLIEEKTEEHRETQKKNSTLVELTIRMQKDDEFLSLVEGISQLTPEQMESIKQVVNVYQSMKG